VYTVAPFRPCDWLSGDPWRPLRRAGRLHGLGATDMKGGLVAAALAFRAIEAAGLRLKGEFQLHAVVGEETMSHEFGTSAVIEAGFGGDAAIVVEPTSSPRPLSVNPISGGNFNLQIDVKGHGTHAGNRAATIRAGGAGDAAGVNAVEKAILVIQALQRLEQEWGITKQHPAFPPGLFSLVPGVFHGDAGVPSVGYMAESATVGYLVWYHPDEAPEAVRAEIERFVHHASHLDTWLRAHPPVFRWESNWPAFETPADHPLVRALVAARAEVLGPLPEGLPDTGAFAAVCDASFLAAKGIPSVVFGPGDLREAHAIDESVEIEEIRSAARVIARAAVRWCGVA
jgi:acetylornithine deacetylase/succinyl-diaminopimelate desuccinylase-like protein